MGFNRKWLPEIDQLKKLKEKFSSDEEFVMHVQGKADAILGSSESMEFFYYFVDKITERKKHRESGGS